MHVKIVKYFAYIFVYYKEDVMREVVMNQKTNLLQLEEHFYQLVDVEEPNVFHNLFPYDEIPKIAFNDRIVPHNMPENIWITDTTFRDGQQSRAPYTTEQIVTIYDYLHKLGGPKGLIRQSEFFLYSKKDRDAVYKCLERGYKFPEVTSWIRASKQDFELVKDIGLRETGILVSCSDYHIFYKMKMTRREAMNHYLSVIRECLETGNISGEQIAGVGIDGQSWSAIAIDHEGNVLTDTPIWMDTRAQEICDRLNNEIGSENIFNVAGNSLQPSYTTAKILWYKENMPEVYNKIYKILQSNSFIAYRLTGAITQDLSQGYGLHCFDMRTGTWDEVMCEKLGIPVDFLPEIVACDKVVGTVTEEAATQSGLTVGTPVVAGGLDAACGTLGAGVIHPGETQEQGGQAGGMSICTDTYKADPSLILGYHVVPGK